MREATIRFEREGLEGIIPIGSYVGDAMRRFGVKDHDPCEAEHCCVIIVQTGEELLSPLTSVESEHFEAAGRNTGERLACHARIEKAGDIVVMTKERKKDEAQAETTNDEEYRKHFAELPLEHKISELMKLEALALGDTVAFIVNSPIKIFQKVGDVMADFGINLENKAKEARRPPEHTEASKPEGKKPRGRKPRSEKGETDT